MNKEFERFNLFIENSNNGFILVDINETNILSQVLRRIEEAKNPLFVDFKKYDTIYYNQNIDKTDYNCVVFFNVQYTKNPTVLMEGFNVNRDNFFKRKLCYVFILPKYLSRIMQIKLVNLYSYMTIHVNLCNNYTLPFRPLLSLDKFVIDKKQRTSEKIARSQLYGGNIKISSFQDLFDVLDYYEYNRITYAELNNLSVFLAENGNFLFETQNVYIVALIKYATVAFNQRYYSITKHICDKLLKFSVDYSSMQFSIDEIYGIIYQEYVGSVSETILTVSQIISIIRLYAGSLFYEKVYYTALQWFLLAHSIIEPNVAVICSYDVYSLNLNDIALCFFKLGKIDSNKKYFDLAFSLRESKKINDNSCFVLDYNRVIYKIVSNKIWHEDYKMMREKSNYYREIYTETSSIFSSYLTLIAWVIGCINGDLEKALELSRKALFLKREVFTENHYSIAESHYCNGVILFMMNRKFDALSCIDKAYRILSNNSEENRNFINIINEFIKKNF